MVYTAEFVKQVIAEKVRGKIIPMHDEFGHHYKFLEDGSIIDSVTQKNIIDKPHLIPWAIGLAIDFFEENDRWTQLKGPTREDLLKMAKLVHRDIRDEAGTIGGKAHDIIEEWENQWIEIGVRPGDIREFVKAKGIEDHRVWGAVRSAEAIFDKYNVIPIATELLVGVPGVGAGTLDLLVLNEEGELELYDYKTSNNMDDFYQIQVAAYKKFFEKMSGLKIKRCRILKLDKYSNRFKVYNLFNIPSAFKAFKALSVVYDWRKNPKDKYLEDKNRITI